MTPADHDSHGAFADLSRSVEVALGQISSADTLDQLRAGSLTTTGGTDIDCVLAHALADPTTTSIVVVTDGYVHPPAALLAQQLWNRNVAVEVVLPSGVPEGPLADVGNVTHLSPRQLGGRA